MHLFFDTETTGTPKNYKASAKEVDNWPRIIQFAWAQFDVQGNLLKTSCDLITPDGWEIPDIKFFIAQGFSWAESAEKEKFWRHNGFSTTKSFHQGLPIKEVLEKFIGVLEESNILIAHNMSFDLPVTQAEMIRAEVRSNKKILKYCTMRTSVDVCKIPGPYGFKWPKLEELHQHLFKTGFDGAHDALNDVLACAKCYFELKNLELM